MAMSINGLTDTSLNFVLSTDTDALTSVELAFDAARVPNRQGARLTSSVRDDQPRTIVLEGWISGSSAATCRSNMDNLISALTTPSPAILIFDDRSSRQITAELVGFKVLDLPAKQIQSRLPVRLTLLALDPYFYDTSVTTVSGITTVFTNLALGTGVLRPSLSLVGGTSPLISVQDYSSNLIFTMQWNYNPGTLVIDCDAMTATDTAVNKLANLTSGDFPALDIRKHGNYANSQWPKIKTSSGTLSVSYRKSWR